MDFLLNISDLFSRQSSSPVTATPHCYHMGCCSQHLSPFTSLDANDKEVARMMEGSRAFATVKKGLFYCHKTLHPQIPEIIGDVGLLYAVPHTTSSQPALTIKDDARQEYGEASQKGPLWRNTRRFMGMCKAYGHYRKPQVLTGDNREMPLHVKKVPFFLSNWKRFNWLRTQ